MEWTVVAEVVQTLELTIVPSDDRLRHQDERDRPMAETLATLPQRLRDRDVPAQVASELVRLCEELQKSIGAGLRGVILYGGLARGRYRPDKSDVDLAVVLRETSADALSKIGPIIHRAWLAQRIEALILTSGDVPELSTAFPVTMLDIQGQHLCLVGDDPFHGLQVQPGDLRKRISQELWNLTLRLRRRYLFVTKDFDEQWRILSEIARPLAIELNWMLYLSQRHLEDNDRSAAIFERAAETFQLDRQTLLELGDLRQNSAAMNPANDLYPRVLRVVEHCAHLINRETVTT